MTRVLLRETRPPMWRMAGVALGLLALVAGAWHASLNGWETANQLAVVLGLGAGLYALFGREFWIEP